MPPRPPFLGRGPHGVGEQEESIRIMKPQPATHRGGTEEPGPVPSPPDGSEEPSPARPGGGGGGGGEDDESRESARGGRTQPCAGPMATAPWQPGRPREILKLQRLFPRCCRRRSLRRLRLLDPRGKGRALADGSQALCLSEFGGPTHTLTRLFVKFKSSLCAQARARHWGGEWAVIKN